MEVETHASAREGGGGHAVHLAFNGWPLVDRPFSPVALHLLEVLRGLRGLAQQGRLSLIHPPGVLPQMPEGVEPVRLSLRRSAWARFRFEQLDLHRAASSLGADVLVYPYPCAPLSAPLPVVAELLPGGSPSTGSLPERLRWAFGRAGLRGAAALIRPADLPKPDLTSEQLRAVPSWVDPAFQPVADPADPSTRERHGLGEGYVLAFGFDVRDLPMLLAAWTWVDGSVGDSYPLVLLGLDDAAAEAALGQAAQVGVVESVRVAPPIPLADLPAVYRGAEAFLLPGGTTCGQELRWALASGVPTAGIETAEMAAILGEAAYLSPPGDARALGSACLALLVEPEVSGPLRQKGLLLAAGYHAHARLEARLEVLESVAAGRHE